MTERGPTPRALALVPARLASSRLPRKMLLRETGRFLFEHTVRNARRAERIESVVLATDSEEILAAAREVGIEALATSKEHASGTDRIQEAARILMDAGRGPWDVLLNIQGDEPEIPVEDLNLLVDAFRDPEITFATLFVPITEERDLESPDVVKVVLDARGDALYFSRSPIPSRTHARPPRAGTDAGCREDARGEGLAGAPKRHVGVYAFRPEALERFCQLPPGELEEAESLEQLRWLEHGGRLRVLEASLITVGIDTPEDYALFVNRQSQDRLEQQSTQ